MVFVKAIVLPAASSHLHGCLKAGQVLRVSWQIERHTGSFRRCLQRPKPKVHSNASLWKVSLCAWGVFWVRGARCNANACVRPA